MRWRRLIIIIILTANGFSPGGSGTTIRHNTQTTHFTENNTTIKRNIVYKITHTISTLHNTHGSQTSALKILVRKPVGERQLGRSNCR
jgi:hypothetical protein